MPARFVCCDNVTLVPAVIEKAYALSADIVAITECKTDGRSLISAMHEFTVFVYISVEHIEEWDAWARERLR